MTSDQITGVLRAVLAGIGGFVLAKGWITSEMWTWITGGVVTIGPIIWTWFANRPASIAVAAQAIPGVTVVTSAAAAPAVKAAVADAKQ